MTEKIKPPRHLSAAMRAWFRCVSTDFQLEPHHVRLLALAATAWDRAEAARAAIEAEGLTYTDRFGAPRARPEVAIERDARLAFARLIRELDLDADVTPESRRPPAINSNRGY
jgi:phage terminase small subunit